MNEAELREILRHLDSVLAVYQQHEGKLSGVELSLKNLSTTLRAQILLELSTATRGLWR